MANKLFKGSEISRLTSIDELITQGDEFRILTIKNKNKISKQKLYNRSMYLYITDESFRKTIENCFALKVSGSQF